VFASEDENMAMTITLPPEMEAVVKAHAQMRGLEPEAVVMEVLRKRFLPFVPRDDWEVQLIALAHDCGVSLPNSAFTAEEMYD
jgi:hypothetical protein